MKILDMTIDAQYGSEIFRVTREAGKVKVRRYGPSTALFDDNLSRKESDDVLATLGNVLRHHVPEMFD